MPELEYVVYRVMRGNDTGKLIARGTAAQVALAILAHENPTGSVVRSTTREDGAFPPPRVEQADEPVWANELDAD